MVPWSVKVVVTGIEIRKVQEIKGSLYVSLPREWTKRFGIVKGSLIIFEVSPDGVLVIRPWRDVSVVEDSTELRKVSVIADQYLSRKLMSYYLLGFDLIEVKIRPEVGEVARKCIDEMLKLLPGLEIIEESKDTIVLQCFTDTSGSEVSKLIQRMINVVAKMLYSVLEYYETGKKECLEDILRRDYLVDRAYFLVVRGIRKALCSRANFNPLKLLDYRLLAMIIEQVGDLCEEFAKSALTRDYSRLSPEVIARFRSVVNVLVSTLRKCIQVYERCDVVELTKLISELGRVENELEKLSCLCCELANLLRRVGKLVSDALDLVPYRT